MSKPMSKSQDVITIPPQNDKIYQQAVQTEDSQSQASRTSHKPSHNLDPQVQKLLQKITFKLQFINQGASQWPVWSIEPTPTKNPQPLPPTMSLTTDNTGFSITFVSELPKILYKMRSPHAIIYQYYRHRSDRLIYFFQLVVWDSYRLQGYEIFYVPSKNAPTNEGTEYYDNAYAMHESQAQQYIEKIKKIQQTTRY